MEVMDRKTQIIDWKNASYRQKKFKPWSKIKNVIEQEKFKSLTIPCKLSIEKHISLIGKVLIIDQKNSSHDRQKKECHRTRKIQVLDKNYASYRLKNTIHWLKKPQSLTNKMQAMIKKKRKKECHRRKIQALYKTVQVID